MKNAVRLRIRKDRPCRNGKYSIALGVDLDPAGKARELEEGSRKVAIIPKVGMPRRVKHPCKRALNADAILAGF